MLYVYNSSNFFCFRELMRLNILSKSIINFNRKIALHLSSLYKLAMLWGCSSYGRALTSHA